MAISTLIDSQLTLVFDNGVDEKGKAKTKSKKFNNIKETATGDQLLVAAQAIASLQSLSLLFVERNDTNQLTV